MAIDASVRQIRVGNDVFVRLSENGATKEAIFAENGEIRFESIAGSKPTDALKLVPGELGPARGRPADSQQGDFRWDARRLNEGCKSSVYGE